MVAQPPLAARIDALLPQTQCTRCGYAGCKPYAEAVAEGSADLNQCPPGGAATIAALAALLGRGGKPLNPANGVEKPVRVAWIDPVRCIGCAKCLDPCPVDAIVGAQRYLHGVIEAVCTGCELCIAPCPVDCIELRDPPADWSHDPARNRRRHLAHLERLQRLAALRREEIDAIKAGAVGPPGAAR